MGTSVTGFGLGPTGGRGGMGEGEGTDPPFPRDAGLGRDANAGTLGTSPRRSGCFFHRIPGGSAVDAAAALAAELSRLQERDVT